MLSASKTRICHLSEAFDYLGFHVRQYRCAKKKRGKVLLITTSAESCVRLRKDLRALWKKEVGKPLVATLKALNQRIRGWTAYYHHVVSKRVFNALDAWHWLRQHRYGKRQHPNKPWRWRYERYWGSIEGRKEGPRCIYGQSDGLLPAEVRLEAYKTSQPSKRKLFQRRSVVESILGNSSKSTESL